MNHLPTITIVTGTLNSNTLIFMRVLESIKAQQYPKKLIEHIVMDGGSTNGTIELAKKYQCTVFVRQGPVEQEQIRQSMGIKIAKGDMILILESDNILPCNNWLLKLIQPFLDNKKVFCTFSAYNTYEKSMSLTTRYCALFGSPDPTLFYLNKTEKIRMDQSHYNKGQIIQETNGYYIVKFTKDTLPTIGDNGHMFLKKAMMKVMKDPSQYTHTDAFMQLLEFGYDTYGVVKNSIIHVMNPRILHLVMRRVEIKKRFYDGRRGQRKYLVFNPGSYKDWVNLIKYVMFALTFIIPFTESFRGYIKLKDLAWFLHPYVCFLMVVGYGRSEIERFFKKRLTTLFS